MDVSCHPCISSFVSPIHQNQDSAAHAEGSHMNEEEAQKYQNHGVLSKFCNKIKMIFLIVVNNFIPVCFTPKSVYRCVPI